VSKLLNAFAILIAVGMTCGPAQPRSLQVVGTAGYLSEWELNGSVAEKSPVGSNEVFRGISLEACRTLQRERSARKIRRDQISDLQIGFAVPDPRGDLARRRSMHLQRRVLGQLERAHGLHGCQRRPAFDFDQMKVDHRRRSDHSAKLSLGTEPSVGHIQSDHNSADEYQHNRDQ
jgi:hypothetical protein